MSETKFTPAPWFAEIDSVESNQHTICQFFDKSENNFKDKDANAALIAAAPAMYAKLQEIAESMDKFGFERTATEIYSLLATARGEANQSNPQQ